MKTFHGITRSWSAAGKSISVFYSRKYVFTHQSPIQKGCLPEREVRELRRDCNLIYRFVFAESITSKLWLQGWYDADYGPANPYRRQAKRPSSCMREVKFSLTFGRMWSMKLKYPVPLHIRGTNYGIAVGVQLGRLILYVLRYSQIIKGHCVP